MVPSLSDGLWLGSRFADGARVVDIADELGVTPRAVRFAAHRHGVALPRRRIQQRRDMLLDDRSWLDARLHEPLSASDIAAQLCTTTLVVQAAVNRHGLAAPRRLAHVRADRVRELAAQGLAFTHIAEQLAAAPRTVRKVARTHGITSRYQYMAPSPLHDPEWLRHRYLDRRETITGLADELGVSTPTVRNAREQPESDAAATNTTNRTNTHASSSSTPAD